MDPQNFVDSEFGGPGRSDTPLPYCVYLPKRVPRSIQLDESTLAVLSKADRALGRLGGAGRLLKNPFYLADLFIRREAVASTRIEGTQATLDDLYDAESGGAIGDDVQEVISYITALNHGLRSIEEGPITVTLITELHARILIGVRGQDKQPGVIRTRPNW